MYYSRYSRGRSRPTRVRNTPNGTVVGYDIQPIRDLQKISDILAYLSTNKRNEFMFLFGINSGLRVSDLLWLKVRDVRHTKHATLRELKTGKIRRFLINEHFRPFVDEYILHKRDDEYLFASSRYPFLPIGRHQAYKILRSAGEHFGLDNIGTHTLRKTFGYHYYKVYRDILTLMKIYNHSDQSVTLDYIGWTQELVDKSLTDFYLGRRS